MFRSTFTAVAVSVSLTLLCVIITTHAQGPNPYTPTKLAGWCAMHGECNTPDQQWTVCLNNSQSFAPDFDVTPLCPHLAGGNVCCSKQQFQKLHMQIQQAAPLFGRCPACLKNFASFWCDYTCSPNQSLFIDVQDVAYGSTGKVVVNETLWTISNAVTNLFWSSCDNVQFGATGQPVVKVVFGADTALEWFTFMGAEQPGGYSPILINFAVTDDFPPYALNDTTSFLPCNAPAPDTCACTDCPQSCQ